MINTGKVGLVIAWALAFAGPPGEDFREVLTSMLAGRSQGRVGQVVGSVAVEPRPPRGPVVPLSNVALFLLPRSAAFQGDLEQIKMKARESEARYLRAVTDVTRLMERYQQALGEAGAGDLVSSRASDVRGEFIFSRVPAGEWLLLGRHEVFHPLPPQRLRRREQEIFKLGPQRVGYSVVTYWRAV